MKYADELRGSEGERCRVTDLRTGTIHNGTIEAWHDEIGKADVRYDDGRVVRVGYSFVALVEDE